MLSQKVQAWVVCQSKHGHYPRLILRTLKSTSWISWPSFCWPWHLATAEVFQTMWRALASETWALSADHAHVKDATGRTKKGEKKEAYHQVSAIKLPWIDRGRAGWRPSDDCCKLLLLLLLLDHTTRLCGDIAAFKSLLTEMFDKCTSPACTT